MGITAIPQNGVSQGNAQKRPYNRAAHGKGKYTQAAREAHRRRFWAVVAHFELRALDDSYEISARAIRGAFGIRYHRPKRIRYFRIRPGQHTAQSPFRARSGHFGQLPKPYPNACPIVCLPAVDTAINIQQAHFTPVAIAQVCRNRANNNTGVPSAISGIINRISNRAEIDSGRCRRRCRRRCGCGSCFGSIHCLVLSLVNGELVCAVRHAPHASTRINLSFVFMPIKYHKKIDPPKHFFNFIFARIRLLFARFGKNNCCRPPGGRPLPVSLSPACWIFSPC